MSEENLAVVRQVYEAAARRDTAAILTLYDAEVELDASALGLEGRDGDVFRGHEGLRSLFGDWHESWGEIEYGYEELIDAGDQVISVVTRHARGRASGVEVEQPFALVWTIREGKVIRVVWFLDRNDALTSTERKE
jgi:ketosteroid isomerase-like protein